ncbi:MAG: ubiquinol-cytochrome c reductase cytochrome c subunit [Actinomycetota bacterium]|jgi:ubiquinol-cytochrome c reductase cytochrome c subunit|nr:ubiquinol-cytochrome c reductase cytochrome c subunit [Actinomycetota bacterium]
MAYLGAERSCRALARALPFAAVACFGVVGFLHAGAATHAVAAAGAAPTAVSSTTVSSTTASTTVSSNEAHLVYLRDCATCHGADARGTPFGPSLQGVGAASVDYWVSTGRMPLVDQGRPPKSPQGRAPPGQYVADPNAQIARHPPFYPPAMIDALVTYVSRIAPGGPPVPSVDLAHSSLPDGGQIFRLQCAACHAWSGVGGALYQRAAPSLHSATPTQIAEAVRTGPGQMPAFGTAAIPADQVDDVVAYVRYLDHPDNHGGEPLWYLGPVAEGGVAILFGLAALLLASRWIGSRG